MLKHIPTFCLLLLTLGLSSCGSDSDQSAPNNDAAAQSIYEDDARFTVISPTLVRAEYSADGQFEDRPTQTLGVRPPAFTEYATRIEDGVRIVQTDALTLHYKIGSGTFNPDNLWVEFKQNDKVVEARPKWDFSPQAGNLGGWLRGLDLVKDPQPLHEGVLSRSGWYLLNDSETVLLTDDEPGFEVRSDTSGDYRDGYIFTYGQNYTQGLKDLRTLTGAAPLLPKKAFGVWFSKWHSYTADEWKQQVLDFETNDVPLETISVDTDWKSVHFQLGCFVWNAVISAPINDACSWNGWDWNRKIFPDPSGFVAWMHERGIDVGLNVHPSIAANDPAYPATVAITGELQKDKAKLPCNILQADPLNPCYVFDWTKPTHLDAYFKLHTPIEKTGIDFWWLDWCCEQSSAVADGLTADTWINAKYAKQHEDMGSRWPAFSRIGGSFQQGQSGKDNHGVGAFAEHRYTMHFTGDTCSTWELMAAQAAMTAAEGNIGLPYVSHDIGSFLGEPAVGKECDNTASAGKHLPDDMYVRWIQLGTFQPIFRLHSHHGDRLPWEYASKPKAVGNEFLRLRGQLVPFLYTLGRQSHDTGLPMTRPLYLQWPEHEAAYTYASQFTLGNDMMVATVAAPGDPAKMTVWIPPGEWVDYFTGESFTGPNTMAYEVALEHYGVFMRKSSILPLRTHQLTSEHGPQDSLIVKVWAGENPAETMLYEDEGRGFAYRNGAYQWTKLSIDSARNTSNNGTCHTLRISPTEGKAFTGSITQRDWSLQFMATDAPQRVTINGVNYADWAYDASNNMVTVDVSKQNTDAELIVTLLNGTCD